MAIVQRGFDQTNLRGSVGAVTYRRVQGATIASQKVPMKQTYKPTFALMFRRMLWANLVALFRSINSVGWHPSFEDRPDRVSDFNEFMARNVNNPATRIFLTRSVSESGGAVVAPVMVTRGSLLPIRTSLAENNIPVSSLIVGGLSIGASTTLGTFSSAIIENNEDWQNGDQLTCIMLHQNVDSASRNPYVLADYFRIVLNTADGSTLLGDIMDVNMLAITDGVLSLSGPINGGVAFIHSRDVAGVGTLVSSQSLVVNNSIVEQYNTRAAFDAAAESYGGLRANEFLTPTSNVADFFAG